MNDVALQRRAVHSARYMAFRSTLERCLAAILLVPGLPLILIVSLMTKATSRGPGIFRQVRTGKDGKTFAMFKIRTMYVDAETPMSGPVWAKTNDPRVTSFGRWLRATHLDELPQLFNVVRGEMSFVGPRPERPEFVAVLTEHIPGYCKRLEVKPGITGLAQINLPADTDLESVARKLVLDRAYIETVSLNLDVGIMLCTAAKLVGFDGQWVARILKLQRIVPRFSFETSIEDFRMNLQTSTDIEQKHEHGQRQVQSECCKKCQQQISVDDETTKPAAEPFII